MLCILSTEHWPAFNFACEEFLLNKLDEDVFFVYRNHPAVVVGKHQNALAEVDTDALRTEGLEIFRRISGGGAVYHDLGNVNFSFIHHSSAKATVDFHRFTQPIRDLLANNGVYAVPEGKNNLSIHGKKISGNAEHLYKNKVLHHGTLLFSTDLQRLKKVLSPPPGVYRHHGMPSAPRQVTNISDHMPQKLSIREFEQELLQFVIRKYNGNHYALNDTCIAEIRELANSKYDAYSWNYGYSPPYRFSKVLTAPGGEVLEVMLNVKNGKVTKAHVFGNFTRGKDLNTLASKITGIHHAEQEFRKILTSKELKEYMPGIPPETFFRCVM